MPQRIVNVTSQASMPVHSYEKLSEPFDDSKANETRLRREVLRLGGIKKSHDTIIHQLHIDLDSAQGQITSLTADLKNVRNESVAKEKTMQEKITGLRKDLADAEAGENQLWDTLDDERKNEHTAWKKTQDHRAKEHRALDAAHKELARSEAENAALRLKIDDLTREIVIRKGEVKSLLVGVQDASMKEELAEAEVRKHLTQANGDNIVNSGLETVISGLKRDNESQQALIDILRRQLAKSHETSQCVVACGYAKDEEL